MKTIKWFTLGLLLTVAQFAVAANATKNIDANTTREAIGFDALTVVPLLVLVIFLVVVGFATQKIPGLKS